MKPSSFRFRLPSRALLPLPLLLLALGCASTPPASPPPLADMPAGWTAPADPLSASAPTGLEWWAAWEDPALETVIGEALAANRELAVAAARVEAAEAQARIAGAARFPQVDAGVTAGRQRQNFIGLPIPGSGDRVLSTTSTSLGVSLNVGWELDLWGRVRAATEGALAELEASRADLRGARLSVAGQAAKAYFALAELDAQLALAEANLDNLGATEELIRRRYEVGLRGPLDLRLAMSSRAGARAGLTALRGQRDAARRQLEVLLGRYPAGELKVAADGRVASLLPIAPREAEHGEAPKTGADPQLPELPPVPARLPAELVVRRPDLAAAEHRLAAAGARVREARAALYPRLSFTTSGGRRGAEIGDLLDGDFTVWSLAGNLLAPLFQGGRLRAGVDLAKAGYDGELARYAGAALAAFAEVETALVAEESLDEQLVALSAAVHEARAAERLAEERYRSGLADYLPVLESQRQSFDAETRLLAARRQRLAARVDLYLALGGDFATTADASPTPTREPAEDAL